MKESLRQEIMRKLTIPPGNMPFSVRSVGHYRQTTTGWTYVPRIRDVLQLFWIANGKGSFRIDRQDRVFGAGMIVCYYPGDWHKIEPETEELDYYWLTIDGPEAGRIFRTFRFPAYPVYTGKCPEWLFENLIAEIDDISSYGLSVAASTAYNIMSLAGSGLPDTGKSYYKPVREAVKIINNNYSQPQLNVNQIAAILNVNRSILSREFKREMNCTIIGYLMITRYHKALELLAQTDYPIAKIAGQCGYSTASYFIRAFIRQQGISPSRYRLEHTSLTKGKTE